MLGRSFDRLCNNTSSTQFAGAVGFLMLHILLALMTASNGWIKVTKAREEAERREELGR